MDKKYFIISDGNKLISCILRDRKIEKFDNILPNDKWDYAVWPTYDKEKGLIYFEAVNSDIDHAPCIFSMNPNSKEEQPNKILKGRCPSISPNGSLLAYYQHPNQLWLMEIKSQKKKKVVSNLLNGIPIVWISDKSILYTDADKRLMKINVISEIIEITGYEYVIPGALSPDGNRVLCGSYDGKKNFIYTIKTNELIVFKKNISFSMGSSFVWSSDGDEFLYTRQTLSNLIKLLEIRSLYISSLEGNEKKLIDRFALFGGFAIPERNRVPGTRP